MDASPPRPKLHAGTWGRLHRQPPPAVASVDLADTEGAAPDALPSIDAIISRTRPVVDRSFNRQRSQLVAREEAVQAAEQVLETRRRELRELEIHLHEKERELLEWDRLVEVRERNLRKREKQLLDGLDEPAAASSGSIRERDELGRARAALQQREEELRVLSERCARRARELDQREAELSARATSPTAAGAADRPSENTLRDWEHQLAQKEAMLKEREAFVEKSENVLFERAQELQILEAELEQRFAGPGDGV